MSTTYTPGQRIDHYEIIRLLGHGGMNHVYLAQDLLNSQKVVLKFPNDDLFGNIAVFERYKREAEIGNRLRHPYIQHLLNIDEERCEDYLVTEYIQGRTLRALLEEYAPNPLPPQEAIRIIIQVCEAIELRGGRGTASSDIYAVGAVLFEMLCGRVPFEGENVFAIMNQHASQDPPSILQFNPTLSPALATVVMRAIRRDADKRYKSINDLLHDLRHLDKVTPAEYKPDTPQAHVMRQPVILVIVVTVAFCLAIIAIGFLVQYLHHVVR